MDTGVTVTGIGKVGAPPNVMNLELGAEFTGTGVQEALEGASAALERMRRALTEGGVAGADLSSGDVTVWPAHDGRQQVVGYSATLRLAALLRNLDEAGALVSHTVGAGGDAARVYGMTLQHADPASLLSRARDAAWKDARSRAEQHGELAGRRLGAVLAVQESIGEPPTPMRAQYMSVGSSERADLPVEPGSTTVTVTVDVRWEFL